MSFKVSRQELNDLIDLVNDKIEIRHFDYFMFKNKFILQTLNKKTGQKLDEWDAMTLQQVYYFMVGVNNSLNLF